MIADELKAAWQAGLEIWVPTDPKHIMNLAPHVLYLGEHAKANKSVVKYRHGGRIGTGIGKNVVFKQLLETPYHTAIARLVEALEFAGTSAEVLIDNVNEFVTATQSGQVLWTRFYNINGSAAVHVMVVRTLTAFLCSIAVSTTPVGYRYMMKTYRDKRQQQMGDKS